MKEKIGVVTMLSIFDDDSNIPPVYKEMFMNPQSYKFISFPNTAWDNKTPVGFFKAFRNDGQEKDNQEG